MMHPKPTYPADHKPFMKVGRAGALCINCKYLKDEKKGTCGQSDFIKWNNGSEFIPGDIREVCSDWFEMREKEQPRQRFENVRDSQKKG